MYLFIFISTFLFCIEYEIKSDASLHDTRLALAVAGRLISKAGQPESVEADLPGLGSCATPVLPELGGKGRWKTPR
jgi:hypothetical protein